MAEEEEQTPDEDNVEAEMLRMRQEEIEEEGGEVEGGGEEGENVGDMLEQEMLRAMQDETAPATTGGGGDLAALSGLVQALPESVEGLDRLTDVEVTVTVELGSSTIAIAEILSWTRDSVVQLDPLEHEPLNVLVNGKMFARGEVVVVGDVFGIRIVELVDDPEEPVL